MSSSSLNRMKEWAIFMDRGTKEIEDFLGNIEDFLRVNSRHTNESEVNQARTLLKGVIDDIKITKLQVRSNFDSVKTRSEELKLLLQNTEAEKRKITESLNKMNSVLRPGEPFSEDSSESFTASDMTSSMDTLSLEPEPLESFASRSFVSQEDSPGPSSNVNESYVVVEVTPGLESRVPKSRLADQRDMVVPVSEKTKKPCGLFGRRMVQLIYSPANEDSDTSTMSNLVYQMETPIKLVESKPSPDIILERPKLPVLSNYVYELLGVNYPESIKQEDTPSS